MREVRFHGVPVQAASCYERELPGEGGAPLLQLELCVITRGRVANKQFIQLTAQEPIRLELPGGSGVTTLQATVTNHQQVSSGAGEAAVYRHDLTLTEVAESAAARAAARAATAAERATPQPAVAPSSSRAPMPTEPEDESEVRVATDSSVWAAALQQLKQPTPRSRAPEEPLDLPQRAGVEAVLVNLRIDALIEQLRAAGLVSRGAVEHSFHRLLRERFVEEATPVVGEAVAKRAARQMLGDDASA